MFSCSPSSRPCVVVIALAAGLLMARTTAAQPVLSVSPTSITVDTVAGAAASERVQVRNAGNRALKWSVGAPSAWWMSVSPTSGTNAGNLVVSVATAGLAAGSYTGSFVVSTSDASQTVVVRLTVAAAVPPPVLPLTVTCPASTSVASPDGAAVAVTYSASTSGGLAPVTWSGTPASGSSFPVGITPVAVTAHSADGRTASCGFSVTVTHTPPPPPPPASAVGPQPTIGCPAGAVDIWPGTAIQSLVDIHPGSTTFCVRAGVHSLRSSVTPRTGNTFVGEYGAVLDGTGWSASDSTAAAFRAQNQDIDYVTIRNLVIRNMPQRGINAFYWMSNHWTVEYNEITGNVTGLLFPPYSQIRNNYIHHNSGGGYLGSYSSYSTIEGNEIAYNGKEQKVGESADVTFRNNFVHHNAGDGIWYDSNNTGALIEGNRVEDNGFGGIFYEISTGAVIRNNIVRRSADTGIFISTSKNTQIYGNTLENNFRGITYFVNCASVGGGNINFDLASNSAHDNVLVVGAVNDVLASAFSYINCSSTQASPYLNGSKGLVFYRNVYDVPSPSSGRYWLWNGLKYWNEWQVMGQDLDGVSK